MSNISKIKKTTVIISVTALCTVFLSTAVMAAPYETSDENETAVTQVQTVTVSDTVSKTASEETTKAADVMESEETTKEAKTVYYEETTKDVTKETANEKTTTNAVVTKNSTEASKETETSKSEETTTNKKNVTDSKNSDSTESETTLSAAVIPEKVLTTQINDVEEVQDNALIKEKINLKKIDFNEYYDLNGNTLCKLVVCTSEMPVEIYNAPSEDSLSVGTISQYGTGTKISETSNWYYIKSGSVTGYVKKLDFVSGKDAEALNAQTFSLKAEVILTSTRLRKEADSNAEVVMVLCQNDVYDAAAADDGWTELAVEGVGIGYVKNESVKSSMERTEAISNEATETSALHVKKGLEKAELIKQGTIENISAEEEIEAGLTFLEDELSAIESGTYTEPALTESTDLDSETATEPETEEYTELGTEEYTEPETEEYTEPETEEYTEPETEEQTEAFQAEEQTINTIVSSDSSIGAQVVALAYNYVGVLPYVWAGADLNSGVDCSGFTMALYEQFGIYLSHDSEVQSCQGYSVPLSEALPGDIVVYYGHVALYIGDGMVIHAPYDGCMVSIASVYMQEIRDVRRVY